MIMPHALDRPYQQESYDRIMNSKAKFVIVQSPTGSGKSAWPAQCAADGHKVISLSHTKSLQAQYRDGYDFAILYGKSNYQCLDVEHDNQPKIDGIDYQNEMTADLCTVTKKYRHLCDARCPYPLAKADFINSIAGALNYHKFLMDRPLIEQFAPELLFLDEAHLLSDLVVDFSGITLPWKHKLLRQYCEPIIIDKPQPLAIVEGRAFLQELYWTLHSNEPLHPKTGGDVKHYKWWERTREKIDLVIAAMNIAPECWFVKSDKEKMIVRPLTARFHFGALFNKAPRIVLMSATIGKPKIFIREMGITDYEYIEVPNAWPAPMRQIVDLQGPKVGYKSTKEDWEYHSKVIADAINQCPDEATGLVHSPSRWLAYDLADRLSKMTGRPMHVPQENIGTEQVVQDWIDNRSPGKICVSWNLWEGINAGEDDICIVAKMPFIDFSEPFDKERFMFDGKAGYQRVANKFTQGLGRIRRGKPEHYGNGKLVAVADGNWKRLRGYIGKDILDAIV